MQEWQKIGVRRFDGGALPKVDINASIVIPDFDTRLLKVPLATSLWLGIDKVAI